MTATQYSEKQIFKLAVRYLELGLYPRKLRFKKCRFSPLLSVNSVFFLNKKSLNNLNKKNAIGIRKSFKTKLDLRKQTQVKVSTAYPLKKGS